MFRLEQLEIKLSILFKNRNKTKHNMYVLMCCLCGCLSLKYILIWTDLEFLFSGFPKWGIVKTKWRLSILGIHKQ